VPLAVRARAGNDLDLAGRQHPDRGVFPAAGAVGERAEHAGRSQAAHLRVRGDAQAQPDRVTPGVPFSLLCPQSVVAEQFLRAGGRGLVVP
jgi:methyl coenzyme M reductase alpha subunit